jgi:hypothetical protein
MGASEGCPVIGQIEVASPQGDNITSPEMELTSYWCSSSRPLEEPMYEAKQMTTAQAVSAARSGDWSGLFTPRILPFSSTATTTVNLVPVGAVDICRTKDQRVGAMIGRPAQ